MHGSAAIAATRNDLHTTRTCNELNGIYVTRPTGGARNYTKQFVVQMYKQLSLMIAPLVKGA